jgi:Iap family predicted aminopeptidase
MKMKPHEKSLGRNPLSDAPYQNLGMVLNGQGLSRHHLSGVPYLDLYTVLNEQGSNRRILSDTLHRRLGIVKNEQESSHLTRRIRVRKLAEPSRLRVGTWNIELLTGKLREVVDTMIR